MEHGITAITSDFDSENSSSILDAPTIHTINGTVHTIMTFTLDEVLCLF